MVRYRFDAFELDVAAFQLRRGHEVLPMQPKVLEVLRYLIERRGRMVPKTELLDALWPGEHVNEAVLSWSVSHIRRAFGQERADKQPIETVHGRGYRFTSDVSELPALAPSASAAPPRAGTFIGRGRVIAELESAVREATHGRGSLLALTGEAGIGKTRCAEELAARAPELGARAWIGRCPQTGGMPPLWPIESALARVEGELAGRARALIASLGEQEGGAEGLRFRVVEQLARCLQQLGSARPTLLVIDDVQWADVSTLELLIFLASELRDSALCVVVTLRDGEREPGSAHDRTLVRALRAARSIALATLDRSQLAELMHALTGHRPSDALAEALHRASGGVPLFAQEVVRSLVREHGHEELERLPPDAVQAPALARDLLKLRVAQLPEATARLLARAAVLGESFELPLLAALEGLEPERLLDVLAPAFADGLLESEAPHAYRFTHALYQAVLYEQQPASQRVAVHKRLGELLAAQPHTARRGAIARHFYAALPVAAPLEVERHAREAAVAARRALSFDEAAMYFSWAIEAQALSGAAEPRARGELMLALASSQRSAGRTAEATATAERIIELAQQHGLHDLVVGATRYRRPTIAMATVPDVIARAALERVLGEVLDTSDPARISALAQLSWVPPYDPHLTHSKELSARAIALAEQRGDRELMFEALRARLFALSGPDDIDEALRVSDRVLELDRAGPHSWQSIDARLTRITACLMAGRIAHADAALADTAATVGGPRWGEASFFCERLRVQRLLLDGHLDEAELRWKDVIKQALRAGVAYADVIDKAFALRLSLEREGPAQAFEAHVRASMPLRSVPRPMRAGYARIAAEAGALDAVRAYVEALGDLDMVQRNAGYVHELSCLSVCAVALGDHARCEQLIELLAPYAALNTLDSMSYYLGAAAYFLGELCEALGRAAQASRYFEQALERNRAMGYRAGVIKAQARLSTARP